jgi:hypothetical protein
MTVELLNVLCTAPVLGRVDSREPSHDHKGELVQTNCTQVDTHGDISG